MHRQQNAKSHVCGVCGPALQLHRWWMWSGIDATMGGVCGLVLRAQHFNNLNFNSTTYLSDVRHVFTFRAALSVTIPLADTPLSLERNKPYMF